MSSVSDLIHSSFRLIGAIAAGEILEATELADAFVSLNQMIASWNTEGASIVGRSRIVVSINPTTGAYILPQRPVLIQAASAAVSNIDSPIDLVDAVGWESIPEKEASSVYVRKLFCDYMYPTSTVYIWPVPRIAGLLELWILAVLDQFMSLDQIIDLPPGYEIALRYNFAVALLPEYPRSQPDPSLPAQAQMYKAAIQQLNASNHMRSQTNSGTQSAVSEAALTSAR